MLVILLSEILKQKMKVLMKLEFLKQVLMMTQKEIVVQPYHFQLFAK